MRRPDLDEPPCHGRETLSYGEGEIEIESITPIGLPDITSELARESGFLGILDLLKVAKHGKGNNIYLIRFHYVSPRRKRVAQPKKIE